MSGTVVIGSLQDLNPYDYVKCLYSSYINTPYNVAFAKKVTNPKHKEMELIQAALAENSCERLTGLHIKADINKIRAIFDSIEGTYI